MTLDAQTYFWYASDTSILGRLPEGYSFANNGWPVFLAPFFALFKFADMISYMEMQRIIATLLSVLTAIPVYFLCRRFVGNSFAVFGAAIFAFEPRLVQNSLLGLNDALYILVGAVSLVLFLKLDIRSRCISFALIGFASLIRSEGLFLFFALSIMYFVQHGKNLKELSRYGVLLAVFIAAILPMAILRIEMTGTDALTGRIINEAGHASVLTSNYGIITFFTNTAITFFGFLGRVMLPVFVFFVPVGVFLILRHRNFEKNTIIVALIMMSIPALYAYSVPALDTKYFYFMYPMFCVLSVFAMKKYGEIISKSHILILAAIIGVIVASVVFLAIKLPDKEQELEYFQVAQFVVHNTNKVNDYYPQSAYISSAQLASAWPSLRHDAEFEAKVIPVSGYKELSEYIKDSKEIGLTHIVIDDKKERPTFLSDIFYHEEKYPYLVKVFDSKDYDQKINLKIFKINYDVWSIQE
ncbi:MAG: glycosyltransferase family 39 protein [Candidatus Nanoarchaeia archaeon]